MVESLKYFFTYKTNVKQRWKNSALVDVLTHEFRTRDREYFVDAILAGAVRVNGEVVSPTKKLGMQDYITHTVHMHEPHPPEIEVIKDEDEYVVINKPAGIPVHPTGGYMFYSVTKALFKDKKVACVNRLDMPVSGVLIIATANYSRWLDEIKRAQKIYIAKVKGEFPPEVEVDKRIKCVEARTRDVSEDGGKECQTFFRRLRFKDGHSLVECRPITGRTHQIRIHLKSVGFPICNDIIYGDGEAPVFEPTFGCDTDISSFEDQEMYSCVVKHCKGDNNRSFNIKDSSICLHAWRYTYNGVVYEAPLPDWADLDEGLCSEVGLSQQKGPAGGGL